MSNKEIYSKFVMDSTDEQQMHELIKVIKTSLKEAYDNLNQLYEVIENSSQKLMRCVLQIVQKVLVLKKLLIPV